MTIGMPIMDQRVSRFGDALALRDIAEAFESSLRIGEIGIERNVIAI